MKSIRELPCMYLKSHMTILIAITVIPYAALSLKSLKSLLLLFRLFHFMTPLPSLATIYSGNVLKGFFKLK